MRWLLLLILLIPIVFASPVNDYNDVATLDIDFRLASNVQIAPSGQDAVVEFVAANVSFFPREHLWQKVTRITADGAGPVKINPGPDAYEYFWSNPASGQNLSFWMNADLHNTNVLHLVGEKQPFPLTTSDAYYTQQTQFIDFTPEIAQQALALAAGEDDLYVVAFKIADWVEQNIAYDLSTVTADVVQPSSWVLENRQGVCDELTNLFISMMRSLGVPTRYVSGLAYTNLYGTWGPHAWAEVYFPNIGWVPFDVTYGQFGWIDPSHIKLKESVDSGDPTITYLWRSNGVEFTPGNIDLFAKLVNQEGRVQPLADLYLEPLIDKVGPGSYVPFMVTVTNLQDYYVPLSLYVTKAQRLTEDNVQRVLLVPRETKKVFWLMQMPEELQNGYLYTTALEVQDTFHTTVGDNVTYATPYQKVDISRAQEMIYERIASEERVQHDALLVQCTAPSFVYSYEEIPLSCTLKNVGTTELTLSACVYAVCKETTIPSANVHTFTYVLPPHDPGTHSIPIRISGDISAKDFSIFTVLSDGGLRIADAQLPKSVAYEESSDISFTISATKPVENLHGFFNGQELLTISSLEETKKVTYAVDGRHIFFAQGVNVTLFFDDTLGKSHVVAKQYDIPITDIPFLAAFIRALIRVF